MTLARLLRGAWRLLKPATCFQRFSAKSRPEKSDQSNRNGTISLNDRWRRLRRVIQLEPISSVPAEAHDNLRADPNNGDGRRSDDINTCELGQ